MNVLPQQITVATRLEGAVIRQCIGHTVQDVAFICLLSHHSVRLLLADIV